MEQTPRNMTGRPQPSHKDLMERIPLYTGIELYIVSTKPGAISMQRPKLGHIMVINYCHCGRLGWRMDDGRQIYLEPGDFSLHTLDACANASLHIPTQGYEGLILCIDLQELSKHLPKLLSETGICGEMLYEKFCKNGTLSTFAGNRQTEAIFSAFYGQPGHLRLAYQKVKTLELLLYLCSMETSQTGQLTGDLSRQAEIIRTIHDQLTQDIGHRTTIEALSKQYLINPTTLKEAFKSVYGTSIAAHIKEHRMEHAARLLIETSLTIAEIGQQIGYGSQSRFTSAFKAHFQMLPSEYRKKHRAINV